MRNANFYKITENAMNEASELSRDMGLLEQSIRMTTSEMQADYADYELTLLSEKKNQVIGHIDELLREAIERHSELSAVRADVLSEVKHYESEYKRAHAAKLNAQRFFGKDSEQAFDHLSRFRFACEMHEKAQKQLTGIDFDLSEMFALINTLRTFLTGETPSVIATESDDLPFESVPTWRNPAAKQISREQFAEAVNALLQKQEVVASIEQYCRLDAAQLASSLRENSRTDKKNVQAALESVIYDNAQDEATADALTDAVNVYFDSVVDDITEALEEFDAPLPSQRRINANIGGVYRR